MPQIDTWKSSKMRFLHSKISKSSETETGMCPPLFWPKIYQNVLFICIASQWKYFFSIPRTFIKWQKKCWKTACSETHATALFIQILFFNNPLIHENLRKSEQAMPSAQMPSLTLSESSRRNFVMLPLILTRKCKLGPPAPPLRKPLSFQMVR